MTDPREKKTPRESGSVRAFYNEALRIAMRFEQIMKARTKLAWKMGRSKVENDAMALSVQAHELAKRFKEWETLERGIVEHERARKIDELLKLQRKCKEMALKTPGLPPESDPPKGS